MKHTFNKNSIFYLMLYLFVGLESTAQTNYKNIILEGSGVRGFAYIGAHEVLDS